MINLSCSTAATATSAVVQAARCLLSGLECGGRIDAAGILRVAAESAFRASDASGAWHWKATYNACEAAMVLFLRRHCPSMRARALSPASILSMLARAAALFSTHTCHSEENGTLQQSLTPSPLGGRLKLRRVRVTGAHRIKLCDFADTKRDLRVYGLFSEIISRMLRMLVPTGDSSVGVLINVLERYPVERVGEREVA